MIKRQIALFFVLLAFALSFSACKKQSEENSNAADGKTAQNDTKSPAQLLLESVPFTEEGLKTLFINTEEKKEITPDAYEALYLAFGKCKLDDDLKFDDCPVYKALNEAPLSVLDNDTIEQIKGRLANSEDNKIRKALANESDFFGLSDKAKARLMTMAENEKDLAVLLQLVSSLKNLGGRDKDVGSFLAKMAEHENPKLRRAVAVGIASSWNEKMENVVPIMEKLMFEDPEEEVREAACKYAGKLKREELLTTYEKILTDQTKTNEHPNCIDGVMSLWWNYPFHDTYSEKAYKMTLDYLNKTPRDNDNPSWSMVDDFSHMAKDFEKWKQNATWYKETDLHKSLADIVRDPNANWMARTGAVKSLAATNFSKPNLEKLLDEIKKNNEDKKLKHVEEAINKALQKMK